MGGLQVVSALAIGVAFAIGIPIGVALIVSIASLWEDSRKSLWGAAPNAACQGARRLMGAGVRGGPPFGEIGGQNSGEGAPGQELDP